MDIMDSVHAASPPEDLGLTASPSLFALAAAVVADKEFEEQPIRILSNMKKAMFRIKVMLNRHPAEAIVDTGSENSHVSIGLLKKLLTSVSVPGAA